jgi:hypothetical protein
MNDTTIVYDNGGWWLALAIVTAGLAELKGRRRWSGSCSASCWALSPPLWLWFGPAPQTASTAESCRVAVARRLAGSHKRQKSPGQFARRQSGIHRTLGGAVDQPPRPARE